MNILKKIYGIIATVAGIVLLTSCDIEPDNRFIELPDVEINKTVLLMDFTGQKCVNCPEAHEIMDELVKQYGDTALVTVSIHAGGLATSVNRTNFERNNIGLMIDEGNKINDAFGINQWPMGVVDRINAPGAALNSAQWATAVRKALSTPSDILIKANAGLSGDIINVNTHMMSSSDHNASLQIWLVEDSIYARQETMNGRVDNYLHNNVLRAVIFPGKDGLPVSIRKNIERSDSAAIQVKWTDKERWNVENLSIVTFVYEGTEIINTAKTRLKTK